MEAHEAFERFEHTHHQTGHTEGEGGGFATRAALVVAVIAAFLAVATFEANEAVKDAIQEQSKIGDTHATLQTDRTQQIILELTRAQIAATVASNPTSPEANNLLTQANSLDKTATSLDPTVKGLEDTRREQARAVTDANNKHLLYELAVVALQIGIVLASVSIIVKRQWLLYGGAGAGVAGVIVLIIGLAS